MIYIIMQCNTYLTIQSPFKDSEKGLSTFVSPQTVQEKLALIQWKKNENELKMRSTLQRTKELRDLDHLDKMNSSKLLQKQEWVESAIKSALQQPLDVPQEYIAKMAEQQILDWKRDHRNKELLVSKLGTCLSPSPYPRFTHPPVF
jgi:hypothetical protein